MIGSRDRKALARVPWRRIHSLPYRRSIAQVSGLASKATMTRLVAAEAILGEQNQPAADTAVPVRVKELGRRVSPSALVPAVLLFWRSAAMPLNGCTVFSGCSFFSW